MKVDSFGSKPIIGKIAEIKEECKDTKTFIIEFPIKIEKINPGQFVMLWVPGKDEFPLGVAGYTENKLELAVAMVGEGTKALFELKKGDLLGVRGFFGKAFTIPKQTTHVLIGGGFGMPPLKFLLNTLLKKEINDVIHVFQGARTKELLMYLDYMEELQKQGKINFHVCTNDGSYGYKGFPTVEIEELLKSTKESLVFYVAGPERMMKAIYDLGKKYEQVVDMQMSLADRHMRCGFGICGACVVDPTGLRICVDGPVLHTEQLEKIEDFGAYGRTASGKKEEM